MLRRRSSATVPFRWHVARPDYMRGWNHMLRRQLRQQDFKWRRMPGRPQRRVSVWQLLQRPLLSRQPVEFRRHLLWQRTHEFQRRLLRRRANGLQWHLCRPSNKWPPLRVMHAFVQRSQLLQWNVCGHKRESVELRRLRKLLRRNLPGWFLLCRRRIFLRDFQWLWGLELRNGHAGGGIRPGQRFRQRWLEHRVVFNQGQSKWWR